MSIRVLILMSGYLEVRCWFSILKVDSCACSAALCIAVLPSSSTIRTSAPEDRRKETMSSCPQYEALCSGVAPERICTN